MKDNIILKKIYQDEDLIELKIKCKGKYVQAWQECYIYSEKLQNMVKEFYSFIYNKKKMCYLEFGKKTGRFTPAFSMKVERLFNKELRIEVDVEIADNDTRKHRAAFYIFSDEYTLLKFVEKFNNVYSESVGYEFMLREKF